MKINNDAISPVVSVVVVLMIVISTMATIVFWGIPYIEQLKNSSKKEDFDKQFASIADTIDDLASSTAGDRRINPINVYDGSLQVEDANIGDRTIVSYSQNSNYNFTVSGLDTCFLAGTKVLMADNSYKNIEEINTDDVVLSYDEQTKGIVTCRVTNAFHHAPEEMTNYYLVINNVLKVTPNHRFYSNGKWIQAGDLKVGDTLFIKAQNRNYIIQSIEKIYKKEQSYDLQVEQCHNYFVSIDDDVDVLVHNDNDPDYIWVTPNWYENTDWFLLWEERARDDDLDLYAKYIRNEGSGWTDYLVLTMNNVIPCSGFQINAKGSDWGFGKMEVSMYNEGTQKKYISDTIWPDNEWKEYTFDAVTVDKVKIRFYLSTGNFGANNARVYEFDFKVPNPECQTLAATEVTNTSAKLNGKVTNDQGLPCDYRFEYDTDGTEPFAYYTWWYGPVNSGDIFNKIVPVSGHYTEPQNGLTPAELYYFRAQVSHSSVSNLGSGSVLSFFTKPSPPSNIQFTLINNNTISYSWTKSPCGGGAQVKTKILAKTVGWPTGHEDANAYNWYDNLTGSSDTETGLIPGQRYNVSMWSWGEDIGTGTGRWSDEYKFSIYTKPSDLSYLNAAGISSSEIQLSWVKAAGSHKTVIRRSITDFPSTPTSGIEIYNGTGILWIDTIPDPVENYYYSAWAYDNDSGYFSDHYATAHVEMVYNIAVTSPKEGYRWKVGTTQVITWIFGESFFDTKVNISLMKVGTSSTVIIASDVDIKDKLFSWLIPFDHDIGEYTINISAMDDSIFDESKKFRIDPRYEGIVDNVTKFYTITQGQTITIDLPDTTSHNIPIKGDKSFTLEMISGQVDRFEIYWLYHEEGVNYSLSGTVCIDLYDGNNWFGSIWIFDSTPITYLPSSSVGPQKVTIEKGGIINYNDGIGQVQQKPPYIYEGNDVFSIHVIQILASSFAAGGSGNARYKVYSNLYGNSAIEEGRTVFNLRLQFYGDNTEVWLNYFVDNYEFNTAGENTLFYAPSAPMEGVKFSFAHATVELEIQI